MCTVYAQFMYGYACVYAVGYATLAARRRRFTIALRSPPSDALALRVHAQVSVRTDSAESSIIAAQIPKCRHSEAVRANRSRTAWPLGRGVSVARNALAKAKQQTTGNQRMLRPILSARRSAGAFRWRIWGGEYFAKACC